MPMLNHAAAATTDHRASRVLVLGACATLALAFGLTHSNEATALDAIDLSEPATPTAEGECSRLVRIKYPLRACAAGELGQTDADDTWENSRTIPRGSDFIEGNGFWGDELNQD